MRPLLWMLALVLAGMNLARAAGTATAEMPLQTLLAQLRAQDLQRGAWALQQGDRVETGRIDAGPIEPCRIGSISKLFTAVLALQLAEQGRLDLDTPLSRWFPRVDGAEQTTVRQLLQHRSGLGDVKDAPDFDAWARQPRSAAELQALIERLPRHAPPGQRTQYNNSGFILLHWIVERAGEAPYEAQLASRITRPLRLTDTRMAPAETGLRSYRFTDGHWREVPSTHPSVPQGAGALVSTPADLTRFIRALFRGELLGTEMLARMTTLQDGVGLGMQQAPSWREEPAFGHEGVIDGFRAALVYLPGRDLAAAVLLNGEHWPRDALLHELLASRLEPGHRPPDLQPLAQDWTLEVAPLALPEGAKLALRGSRTPLSWEHGLPFTRRADGRWQLALRWQAVAGLPLETKLVVEDREGRVLRWETGDNRRWTAGPPPGPLRFDVKGEAERVWQAVMEADRRMFEAFNRRDAGALATFFSDRLEFFHDRGGLAGKVQTMAQLGANFGRLDRSVRRELLPEGLEIHPLPGIGAMQIGRHRFCSREGTQPEQCSVYGFSTVWEEAPSGWQQLRVMSYGH